jgi:D-inositol-3-phosphate glycosyltransferase
LPEFVEEARRFMAGHGLRYTVLHSHYWFSGWVALQLRQWLQIPMVHMSHTLGAAKNAAAQQPWEQEPPRRLRIEQDILRGTNAVIAESPPVSSRRCRHMTLILARSKLFLGVDTAIFRPQSRQHARQSLGVLLDNRCFCSLDACSP